MLLNYLLPVVVGLVSLARADYTITVHNNCDEVIYAAAGETNAGFAMDPSPPSQADFESGRVRSLSEDNSPDSKSSMFCDS